ncbi:MAG: NAD-dependent epimerase/dehydratase family protein, partial [candidate division KSB1 bacterium]|nr:NAD-dependent epimerase/dehydratase family protein [candidate division KSB1 bacterium]
NFLLRAPKEWQIVGIYHTNTGFLDFLRNHRLTHVRPVQCDLNDEGQVKALFQREKYDFTICLYLAALVNIPLSVKEPSLDHRMNVLSLLNFLKYFRGGKLIYMSSGAVYDGWEGLVDPSKPLNPTLPYAISKLTSEQYIKCYRERKATFDGYVILRFYGAFGPYERSHKIYTKLVKAFYLNHSKEFTIYGDGTNLIDAMYVDDAIDGLLKVIASERVNLVVDFTKAEPTSIEKLVQNTAEIFGVGPVEIHKVGTSNERILWYSSREPMEALFGFSPQISYRDGILRFAKFLAKEHE